MPVKKVLESHASGKPRLAVFKFSSCDGCQLQLLNLEDELLDLVGAVEIAYFLEVRRRELPPPYDIGLVEGSVSTAEEEERIQLVRRDCKYLITIGACATSGGIQALRNWANIDEFVRHVYPSPEHVNTLETATPIAAHVFVDFELRGCPVNQLQLLELISSLLAGRKPNIPDAQSVHRVQAARVAVRAGERRQPCLGPITQAGCGALCPVVGPALLRLLRPDGAAEHGLAGQLVHVAAGLRPAQNETDAPHVQWILGTFQASE